MRSTPSSDRANRRAAIGFALIAAFALSSLSHAAPRVPSADDEVLERLPPALLALRGARVRAPAAEKTPPVEQALADARRYVELGRTYADPRAYGYAQAALGSWWSAPQAPAPVLVMRARILQFRHEFDAALAQLQPALDAAQFDPDGWLLLASIEQVRGNVPAMRAACLKLLPISDPLVGATCVASTGALSGQTRASEQLLTRALQAPTGTSVGERAWAWTALAELRARVGDDAGAEAAFKSALALQPDDVYARAAYADLLLDLDRTREARAALGDASSADALLLRAAIAAARLHDDDAAALRAQLAERFAEARARGDQTHLREQGRFALDVEHDANAAVDLASRNFALQREPADARLLLEAAAAAHRPDAAQPALEWMRATKIDAPRFRALADRIAAPSRG